MAAVKENGLDYVENQTPEIIEEALKNSDYDKM